MRWRRTSIALREFAIGTRRSTSLGEHWIQHITFAAAAAGNRATSQKNLRLPHLTMTRYLSMRTRRGEDCTILSGLSLALTGRPGAEGRQSSFRRYPKENLTGKECFYEYRNKKLCNGPAGELSQPQTGDCPAPV